jgi:tetratricopeptide (TPR) repeat protein
MMRFTKIATVTVISLLLLYRCSNKTETSQYDEILSQPPFSATTDSIKSDRKNADLYFRRAVLLNTNNFPEPALADFRKAWSLRKEEPAALGIANLLLDKKPDSAIAFINEAIKYVPNSLLLRLTLAHAFESMGNWEAASSTCDEILSRNPNQVDVLKLKADLLDKTGKGKESITVLENAYHITPYDIELNYILALKYAEAKNSRVLQLCDSLIKIDSLDAHAEPYYYKGIYYANTGEKNQALYQFNEAIRHDYYFLDAYIEKGSLLLDAKKYAEAISDLQLVLTISPKYADGYYWLAKCYEAMGNKPEANINYQKALGLDNTLKEAKEGIDRTR